MRTFVLLLALLCMAASTFTSQIAPPPEAGIVLSYGYNMHNADFGGVPCPVDCHRDYGDGSGNGYALGISFRYWMGNDWALSGRLLFTDLSAKTQHTESSQIMVHGQGSEMVDATFVNTIQTTIQTVAYEPLLEYHGIPFVSLRIGASLSIPVTMEFQQQEFMLYPEDLVYLNQTRYRENKSGDIPNAPGAFFSALAGVALHIPLGGRVNLVPEVMYMHTFNDVMNNTDWKPHALRAGVGVTFSL